MARTPLPRHADRMTSTPTAPSEPGDPGGSAGPSGHGDTGPRLTAEAARDLGSLRRTVRGAPEGRHIAGVAGGLARHFDVDPTVVRVGLVVLCFFGGAGILLYAAGWLLIPEEESDQAVVRMDRRSRTLVLYVAAGLALLALLGDTVGGYHFPWPLVVIGLVVLVVLGRRGKFLGSDGDARVGWVPWTRPEDAQPARSTVNLTKDAPSADAARSATSAETTDALSADPLDAPIDTPIDTRRTRPLPRDPRKRGPVLFGLVLAAIALAEGVLGMADVAGANVAPPAYPALALGIIGAGLVLGSVWGRAGGLIVLGLIGTVALVASVAANEWDVTSRHIDIRPTSAAALHTHYDFDLGEVKIDLTRIDPAELAGRTLSIDGNVGQIEVVVPDDVAVDAHGSVGGPGQVDVFEDSRGGFGSSLTGTQDEPGAALTIDATLDIGQVQIFNEHDPSAAGLVRSNR